ncbi:MAG: tRNA (adenosine(37)-N6)-dimethylallyltransferase MiaA [bacterium]
MKILPSVSIPSAPKSKSPKTKVLVILGQTATGKSDLAVAVARKFGGEVISADSRQVYKGLDIGTGKITKKEMQGVPHYLLDVASAKKKFTVAEYKALADAKIADIISRGKLPILCGGTGFYINAVTSGAVFPEVPPNQKLRATLEKKSAPVLFAMLKKLDARRANGIDAKNKVRLVRAIEIAKYMGKVPAVKYAKLPYQFIKIGLTLPLPDLETKIKIRLEKRIKAGMLREATRLHAAGLSWKRMEELGLEYRHMALYLQKKISKQEMIAGLETAILQYAKRQMTWFKRDKKITWYSPKDERKILLSLAKNFH